VRSEVRVTVALKPTHTERTTPAAATQVPGPLSHLSTQEILVQQRCIARHKSDASKVHNETTTLSSLALCNRTRRCCAVLHKLTPALKQYYRNTSAGKVSCRTACKLPALQPRPSTPPVTAPLPLSHPAYLAHKLTRLSAKDVVHDACAAGIVLEARQQRTHTCCCVCRVQLPDHFIWQVCQLREQLRQVAAHVGVRAVPHREVGHLS
jgi:hypothetical protein